MDIIAEIGSLILSLDSLFPDIFSVIWSFPPLTFIVGLIGNYGILMIIFSLYPLMINRYFVTEPAYMAFYNRYFTKKLCILYSLLFDILPLPLVVACNWPVLSTVIKTKLTLVFYLVVLLCIIGAAVLGFIMHRSVNKHMKIVTNLQQKERIKETKQLLNATLIQALVPIVCEGPLFLFIVLMYIVIPNVSAESALYFVNVSQFVELFSIPGSIINPIADAVATLTLVKQYRNSFKKLFRWSTKVENILLFVTRSK